MSEEKEPLEVTLYRVEYKDFNHKSYVENYTLGLYLSEPNARRAAKTVDSDSSWLGSKVIEEVAVKIGKRYFWLESDASSLVDSQSVVSSLSAEDEGEFSVIMGDRYITLEYKSIPVIGVPEIVSGDYREHRSIALNLGNKVIVVNPQPIRLGKQR